MSRGESLFRFRSGIWLLDLDGNKELTLGFTLVSIKRQPLRVAASEKLGVRLEE